MACSLKRPFERLHHSETCRTTYGYSLSIAGLG